MPMQLLRVHVEAKMTAVGVFMGPMRCGAPTALGLFGTAQDSQEPLRVLAFEWPTAYAPSGDKAAKELQHLNRFNADFRAGTGSDAYTSIEPVKPDPPDFRCVTRDGTSRGVECTQLLLEDRASASARFRNLRFAVMGTNRHRFRHLQGYVVYVSLDDVTGRTRAARSRKLAGPLIAALERHDPSVGSSLIDVPDPAPPGITTPFPGGVLSSTRLEADPGSLFSRTMGFDLALSHSSTVRESEAWDWFGRLVREHDAAGVDEIVVSAEAPTADGYAYPSDAAVAQAVIEHAANTALTARHVEVVYLHVWGTRSVARFVPGTPGAEVVCGTLPMQAAE